MKHFKYIMIAAVVAVSLLSLPAAAVEPDKKPKQQFEHRDRGLKERKHMHPHAMRDKDFSLVLNVVKKASFDDRKIDVMRVACIGSYFSSEQCARLLSLLSFDDNKVEALEVIAPRLVESDNAEDILKKFSFSSSKDKAIGILLRRQK